MAWGRSPEQQSMEQVARDGEFRRQIEAWAVGLATAAHQRGDGFFQTQLKVSELVIAGSAIPTNAIRPIPGGGSILGQIEYVGWTLEHVGYVFVQMGSTHDSAGMSRHTATKGEVDGIYLFRRAAA